jgi:hypothetical protein
MIRQAMCVTAAAVTLFAIAGQAQATGTSAALPKFVFTTTCSGPANNCRYQFGVNPSAYTEADAGEYPWTPSAATTVSATLTYSFRIDGPDDGPVRVDINAYLIAETSILPGGSAFAEVLTSSGSSACVALNDSRCAPFDTYQAGGYDEVTELNARLHEMDTPGTVYTISLIAEAGWNGVGNTGGSASVDPVIFVDPHEANADLYTVDLSPQVTNIAGIPEPASWALMLVGFGGLGAALRTRRRAVA